MSDKLFRDYPIAKTYDEALKWIEEGGELWQEYIDGSVDCVQIEDAESLDDYFPEHEVDESDTIHLVSVENK